MSNTIKTPFDELAKLASDFVIQQKGVWDHAAWIDFLSRVEKSGIDLSENMQLYLGELVEAIKQFHTAIISVEGTMLALNKLVLDSAEFIKKQNGIWSQDDWNRYSMNVSRSTIYLSDEMTSYLDSILESMKSFYSVTPPLIREKGVESETIKEQTMH